MTEPTPQQILQRIIWQTANDMGFKFNETDSWEMMEAIEIRLTNLIKEPKGDTLLEILYPNKNEK